MSESKTAHRDRYYHPSDINDRSQGIEQSEWDAEYTPSDLLPSATFDGRVDNQINVLPFRLRMGRPESGDGTVTPNKPNETASINVTYGSLPSGTYGIINTKYHHLLTLPSRNAGTNVVGVSPSENGGIYDKWKIVRYPDDTYSITHEAHGLSANPSAPEETVNTEHCADSPVVGQHKRARWRIRELQKHLGNYIIFPLADEALNWYLKDDQLDTTTVTLGIMKQGGGSTAVKPDFRWRFWPRGGDVDPIFSFKHLLNCSPISGPQMSHFVEAPLNVDLREDFTILAWAFCRDRSQWRSIISFESPQVSTSLLTLTLPPSHKPSIPHVAYMTGARPSDFGTLQGQMEVPMNVWFHVAAVFKAGVVTSTLELYVNGEEGGSMRVEDRWIFNAKDISVVLGSSTINNNPAWQWSGSMTDVYVYQASMTKEQIAGLMAEGSLPRVRSVPLGLAQFDASPETSEGMSPPGAITPSLWQSNPTPFIFSGGVSK